MEIFLELITKFRTVVASIEPWWTIALVPIWQEVIFRYLPFQFWYLPTQNFWLVGIVSSFIFALIHWYFGLVFAVAAFFAGLIYWWVMVHYGLVAVILVHALVNIIDLTFGIRHYLANLFQ